MSWMGTFCPHFTIPRAERLFGQPFERGNPRKIREIKSEISVCVQAIGAVWDSRLIGVKGQGIRGNTVGTGGG